MAVEPQHRALLSRWLYRLWRPTLVILILAAGILFHYLSLGIPGIGYSGKMELLPVGWSELGRAIEQVSLDEEKRTGHEPLAIGLDKYFIASQLAFYHPNPLTGIKENFNRNFVGGRGLMFEFWSSPERYVGDSIVIVGFEREELETPQVAAYFDSLGPIQEGRLFRHQRYIRSYFYRMGYLYRAKPALGPALPSAYNQDS